MLIFWAVQFVLTEAGLLQMQHYALNLVYPKMHLLLFIIMLLIKSRR